MNRKSISALAIAALLAACATAPTGPAPAAVPAPGPAPEPASLTRVYFYAKNGQPPAQQDRDRYECFNWAVQQTGFDPSRRAVPREHREQIVPAQPAGGAVIAGALTGAMIGAAVSDPWDRDEGAVVGAIAGTAVGALAASYQANATRTAQKQVSPERTSYEQQAAEHRRAMSACLEGRGYVVK